MEPDPIKVHGGIRHLENRGQSLGGLHQVHGGIRHLEMNMSKTSPVLNVHGGIRHLESVGFLLSIKA